MNYTEKYHLPQWVKEDRIMMEDFNAAMASIEGGMTANAQAAEQAAQLPYVVGSYKGNGASIRDIHLGFKPRFLVLCKDQLLYQASFGGLSIVAAGSTINSKRVYLTETGFRLDSSDTVNQYPEVNINNTEYNYIAFR